MKKISILAGILFLFTIANGQFKKGTFLLGGQSSFSSSKTTEVFGPGNPTYQSSTNNNLIVFSIARAFKDNDVYGFSVGFFPNSGSSSIYSGGYSETGNENTYSFGIYNRTYKKIVPSLYSFCELGTGLSFSHKLVEAYSAYLYFTPGISYRIHKYIDIELLMPNLTRLFYNTNKAAYNNGDYKSTYKNSSYGLSTSLSFSSISAGVRIIL